MITILAWLKFIAAVLCIFLGIIIMAISVIGLFRFNFILNRMHAAAMGDTLGILLVLTGLMIISGLSLVSLKLLLIIIFLWFASPVSSHLISRLELSTDERVKEECEVIDNNGVI